MGEAQAYGAVQRAREGILSLAPYPISHIANEMLDRGSVVGDEYREV